MPDSSRVLAVSEPIAAHILEFLEHEVKKGRMPTTLLPMQSGVGNISRLKTDRTTSGC
jgi:succinyl-CoA:acetate CoA-transferase